MDPRQVLALVIFFAPTLLAGVVAGVLALSCRRAWKAFAVGLLGTIILAAALGALADRLPIWGQGWSAGVRVWLFHLMISPLLGVPLGAVCAAWVANRAPPSIRG